MSKQRRVEPTEAQVQAALVQWWRLAHRGLGVPDARLLIMIPNGAYLGGGMMQTKRGGVSLAAIRFAKLKREGFVPGAPDFLLAVPRGGWAGLFLELKREKRGRVDPKQREMMDLLVAQGYAARVACGLDAAVESLTWYLGLRGDFRASAVDKTPTTPTEQHHNPAA